MAPSSFMNSPLSLVASSSRTGRKRHRRSRRGTDRASRGVPRLLESATSVVSEEPMPVGRRVEIPLNRSEPPTARPPPGGATLFVEVATVETRMRFHLAPYAERGSTGYLRESGRVGPAVELRHGHQFRPGAQHFAIVRQRRSRTSVDGYMRLIRCGLKATPWVLFWG